MTFSTIRKRRPGTRRGEPAVKVARDGREMCADNRWGSAEYQSRLAEMQERQGDICCLFGYSPVCHPTGLLLGYRATFEHEHGRGMGGGKRDDRIVLPDGRWQNGAAHLQCNSWKGSRFIPYNEAHNSVITHQEGPRC